MARKHQLRAQRTGTVINATSKEQEKDITKALKEVVRHLRERFPGLKFAHNRQWLLREIVRELRFAEPGADFHFHFDTSALRPDGGILTILGPPNDTLSYPILIAEVKNQGTNDLRASEGRPKQARGNAIERLGKNLIGLRTALMREQIFPFVCFGYGCDFAPDSSILDRVSTMAMFGRLNRTYLYNEAEGRLSRGSFYFRERRWSVHEMADIMQDISVRAVQYYLSKYREVHFRRGE